MTGSLVLVVGPSGAGKDTLIHYARERFRDDPRVVFPRRVITRPPSPETEDFLSVSQRNFEARLAAGDFALHWCAHGLAYALPVEIENALAEGRAVVANVSRRIVDEARQHSGRVRVVEVSAPPDLLAERLRERGREGEAGRRQRLSRTVPAPLGADAVRLDNSGRIEIAGEALVRLIRAWLDAAPA